MKARKFFQTGNAPIQSLIFRKLALLLSIIILMAAQQSAKAQCIDNPGTYGNTLYDDGSCWISSQFLYYDNDNSRIGIGTTSLGGAYLTVGGPVSVGYTGVYPPSNGMVIAGTVGIGLSNPSTSYQLHVNGDVLFNNYFYVMDQVGIGTTSPGSNLSVYGGVSIGESYATTTSPSDGLIIEGNVGIGTSSPSGSHKLHVAGNQLVSGDMNVEATIITDALKIEGLGGSGDLSLFVNNDGEVYSGTASGTLPTGSNGQTLRYNSGNWVADNFLYNNGSGLGIGTTSVTAAVTIEQASGSGISAIHVTRDDAGYSDITAKIGLSQNGGDPGLRFVIYENSSTWHDALHLNKDGRVGIGTVVLEPGAALTVEGTIVANEIKINDGTNNQFVVQSNGMVIARQIDVNLNTIPDYVFHAKYDKDSAEHYRESGLYSRMNPEELEEYIKKNRHLPGIKSAAEYKEAGSVNVGELQMKLLEKIEELTLDNIQLNKDFNKLKAELEILALELAKLKK